jgi:sec-independent protein translocase protein TatA
MSAAALTLADFNLGAGEIILILALVLILFGSKRSPDIGRGLRLWRREFRKATQDVKDEVDGAAHGAGESLGGIYGKPAAEALTPDNQVAELYDPAAFQDRARSGRRVNGVRLWFWRRLWLRLRALFVPRAPN